MKLVMIVACTENRVIGRENQMPWHLPKDLAYFRAQTTGNPIIMGRKTFESIGKPLPNRKNIMLSESALEGEYDGEIWCTNPTQALEQAKRFASNGKAFVIGGAMIYKAFWDFADELWITHIHTTLTGDAFFPDYAKDFEQYASEFSPRDEKNAFDLTFARYRRLALSV